MRRVTRAQAEAVFKLFRRDWPNHAWGETANTRVYRRFRRRFRNYGDYIGIADWRGMFVGIERDGYTHT